MGLNEDILAEDPNSQAVEADESVEYTPTPDEDSGVVVVEPDIITYGRAKYKHEMRQVPKEQQ